ncbi:MAG: murein biosynthesis integral membrane protein MurJ [Treponema sp.]|nr:murein biosynthesis integral membrane protein MurJ [Treponema sp.]
MSDNKKSLIKSGISLSAITFLSRIMGLIREITKASFLGTTMYADAFTTSFMLPNLLRRLFAEGSISVAFIPTFKKYLAKEQTPENRKETQDFLAATFTLVTFCTTCVVVLGVLFAPLITLIFCHKPDPTVADYAEQLVLWSLKKSEITLLTRIMAPYLLFISIAAFFQGILNSEKIFAPSGFTPVLLNGIVILATYLLSPYTANPARAMSIGVIVGGFVQAAFQWPFVHKTGWRIALTSLKKTFSNPGTKQVLLLIGPTIIGMAAYQLNNLVSTSVASNIGDGYASSLEYSLRLQELILGIFAVSISTVILPDMSVMASKKDWKSYNELLSQAVRIIIMISIPVTAFSLFAGKELICLVFKTNSFNDHSVMLTLGEFRYHIAGLLFIALNRIISPAFYAQGNTKLPTLAGIISVFFNILFVFILVWPMKGNGIALALTLASAVNTLFLLIFMGKKEEFDLKGLIKSTIPYTLKLIVLSVIAVIPPVFMMKPLLEKFAGHHRFVSYGIPVALCGIVFAAIGVALLVITGDNSMKKIVKKLKR